jgi:hypothetical protein
MRFFRIIKKRCSVVSSQQGAWSSPEKKVPGSIHWRPSLVLRAVDTRKVRPQSVLSGSAAEPPLNP